MKAKTVTRADFIPVSYTCLDLFYNWEEKTGCFQNAEWAPKHAVCNMWTQPKPETGE